MMVDDDIGSGRFSRKMIALYPELYESLFTSSGLYDNDMAVDFIKCNNLPLGISFHEIVDYISENEHMHEWWML